MSKPPIQRLFELSLFGGIKMGLENCLKMNQLLGFPEKTFASVHVAGTNGKGSTCTKIASALQYKGDKVGLYTSPHISSFRERIKINGIMISENSAEELLSSLFAIKDKENIPCTFFEMMTLLAFLYFAQEKVDYAILETGLGGRLDATNIATPILSIITSISLDHTDVLSNDIDCITREKAGIIKEGVPILIGPCVSFPLIKEIADVKNTQLVQIKDVYSNFELENRAIAEKALEMMNCPREAIEIGLNTMPPCRFEVVSETPPVILDAGHNPDGLMHLFDAVKQRYPVHPLRVVFGLSKNKDISSCIGILSSYASSFHPVEAPNGRGMPVSELKHQLLEKGVSNCRIFTDSTIEECIKNALKAARENHEALIICGSFFIMSDARMALGIIEARDQIDINERSHFFL